MNGQQSLAKQVVKRLKARGLFITAVESCTGGGLANCITHVSGASDVFLGSWVVYSNAAKLKVGVPLEVLETYSVYSPETAVAMAQAGVVAGNASVSVGITGHLSFPDPTFGNRVFIAVVLGDSVRTAEVTFPAEYERWKAKEDVIQKALQLVLEIL